MSEFIHVETTSIKRTLTMHLDPDQARVLINALTDNESIPPKPAAREFIRALYAIRDGKTIVMHD